MPALSPVQSGESGEREHAPRSGMGNKLIIQILLE